MILLNDLYGRAASSERVGQEFYFYLGSNPLVEDIVDGIEDRHIDMEVAVDLLHTFGSEIALGNHFHFYLRTLHTISFSNHRAESAVTREIGVARHK